jgi:hypothetical protein
VMAAVSLLTACLPRIAPGSKFAEPGISDVADADRHGRLIFEAQKGPITVTWLTYSPDLAQ